MTQFSEIQGDNIHHRFHEVLSVLNTVLQPYAEQVILLLNAPRSGRLPFESCLCFGVVETSPKALRADGSDYVLNLLLIRVHALAPCPALS